MTYKRIRVLYDHQAFEMQTHGGVSRCFAELYKHLPADIEGLFTFIETENTYLLNMGFPYKGYTYDHFMMKGHNGFKKFCFKIIYNFKYGKYSNWDKRPMLNQFELERKFSREDFDIFHPTFFDSYFLPLIGERPFVVTVHDMIPELYPQYYDADDFQILQKRIIIAKASHIIAVSENTKRDILKFFDIPEEKITVIYHGTDEMPYTPSPDGNKYGEYVLFVGERHSYKNFDLFIHYVEPILMRHPQLKIVCTGKPFTEEEMAMLHDMGITDRVIQIFVNGDQEFMDLYHNAIAFVYPSEYEGFGIPILEAYKAQCPVMLNDASCFPEIAADAAVFFTMKPEGSDFEEKFEKVYSMSTEERQSLIHKQNERLKLFSWGSSAEKLAEVYKSVLRKSNRKTVDE